MHINFSLMTIVMVLLMMAGSYMRDALEGALVTEVGLHPDTMLACLLK